MHILLVHSYLINISLLHTGKAGAISCPNKKKDFYEVLGISRNASDDEIKKAYRQLAKKYHPDVNPGDTESEQKFKEASEAYGVLSDKDKKDKYDRYGHAGIDPSYGAGGPGASGFGGFDDIDLGSIFEGFFGGGFGGTSRRNTMQKGESIRVNLTLSFEEAVFGCEKNITVNRIERCESCSGTGAQKGTTAERCPACNGTGQVKNTQRTPFGVFFPQRAPARNAAAPGKS